MCTSTVLHVDEESSRIKSAFFCLSLPHAQHIVVV